MPEHKFYLHASWQWPIALLFLIMTPFVFLFFLGVIALFELSIEKAGIGAQLRYVSMNIMIALYVLSNFLVLYGIFYNPHVVLTDKEIIGQAVNLRFFGLRRGRLAYTDLGRITEGSLFGIRYKCYYSALIPNYCILIFKAVRDADQCFNLIDKQSEKRASNHA